MRESSFNRNIICFFALTRNVKMATSILIATFIVFIFLPTESNAQIENSDSTTKLNPAYFGARVKINYGYISSHHPEMKILSKRHFNLYQFDFFQQTDGRALWQSYYNYPEIGVSYCYSNLGNNKILGSLHAIYPYIDFPFLRTKTWTIIFRFGVGCGYISNPFDLETNYKNSAIGSHINAMGSFEIKTRLKLSEQLHISSGLSAIHVSNGTMSSPNSGINVPSIFFAVDYSFQKEQPVLSKFEKPKFEKLKWKPNIFAAFAIKDNQPGESPKYFTGLLSFNLMRKYSFSRSWGFGLDFDYDQSDISSFGDEVKPGEIDLRFVRPGIKAIHEWHVSRLTIGVQMGAYIYTFDNRNGSFYDILLLMYRVSKNINVGVALKTHWAKADFVSFGLQYNL